MQLTDNNSVPFLTFTTTDATQWPANLTVSASPGTTTGTFNLEVVYAPGGNFVATLESFENLSPSAPGVSSEFITSPTWIPPAALANLQLFTRSDCRIPWPSASACCCGCGCTVSVQPGDTLQEVLDKYKNLSTPTEICFGPGTYNLTAPLELTVAHSNITLKACQEGTVTLQAQSGAENLFGDGLVVLHSANHVSLLGLQFSLPWMPAASLNQFQFAGWPVASLDPPVAQALSTTAISIGVRPINCSALSIEHCEFTFADPNALVRNSRGRVNQSAAPILFGVGIFAGGSCEGLQLAGNTFTGGYLNYGFLAGFLLAPTVAFSLPPAKINYHPTFEPSAATTDLAAGHCAGCGRGEEPDRDNGGQKPASRHKNLQRQPPLLRAQSRRSTPRCTSSAIPKPLQPMRPPEDR